MKTLAQQVISYLAWRTDESGEPFTVADLAAAVSAVQSQKGIEADSWCKRQDIENLLKKDLRNPRYIAALAAAMGTTVEALKAGTFVPGASASLYEAAFPTEDPHDHVLAQYDAAGAMGNGGLILEEQPPGLIKSWRVDPEWLRLNVPHHTGLANLCIVTGFGPSMKPKYNPGDPLLIDRGITNFEKGGDGVYFFRVGNHGFIKQLQRIPTEDGLVLRAKSFNKDYDPFDITPKMREDFAIFGKVLTIWRSEQV